MPAAGDALSAYSLERQRVRRRPGAQPRISLHRPKVANKIKRKTGGSRPARRLTFFNAKKVSKNAGFYFCCESLWLFSTVPSSRPLFLRGSRKHIRSRARCAHTGQFVRRCPNGNGCSIQERPRCGCGGATWPIERPAARWGDFSACCEELALLRWDKRKIDLPDTRDRNARRRRKLFLLTLWSAKE
ncbi:hypothetical protein EDC39_107173 [Geothermobacter ehrlichii]|uniref:Uncharacterized protein n=1 Tax=Geothermobacter ehrlichii TaxID=213224 RepID=A0A5D3WM61_9BACT|nr:hypothetical protein EDC39_107173 [Geothermobacter ehrlichii]